MKKNHRAKMPNFFCIIQKKASFWTRKHSNLELLMSADLDDPDILNNVCNYQYYILPV